jgi:hypothetical protein
MKKKILLILACIIAMVMLCASMITCSAAEISETEVLREEIDAVNESNTDSTQHTVFSRVWEYCITNKTEVLGLSGDAVIFVLAIFVKLRNDKRTKGIESDLKIVKGDASGTAQSQSVVVGAVNGMIDGYNNMRDSYEKYGHTEEDRNKLIGAVMVQNTAILEILSTVYVNNKNMPQGVKDLVNLKYANCLKELGDDKMLCAIVESVREKVGKRIEETVEEPKEDTEAMEV